MTSCDATSEAGATGGQIDSGNNKMVEARSYFCCRTLVEIIDGSAGRSSWNQVPLSSRGQVG
jgi:hypothetical protein